MNLSKYSICHADVRRWGEGKRGGAMRGKEAKLEGEGREGEGRGAENS